jgi:putative transposase
MIKPNQRPHNLPQDFECPRLMTPGQVHYGQIDAVHAARQVTLDQAFLDNPERFVKKPPVPPANPTATWINPPTPKPAA